MYEPKTLDFDAIRISLASPEVVMSWSRGEVTKPETINYRTQKPEKHGLFCEMIFGPTKDWECYCGKYKKLRYKGIVCDKCGVEVTHSIVRRERMGHIELATPVAHIWFLRSVPSKMGLVLDIGVQTLEKVVYFANFIVTDVNEDLRKETVEQVKREYKGKKKQIESEHTQTVQRLKSSGDAEPKGALKKLEEERDRKLEELEEDFQIADNELKELKPMSVITEQQYQELSLKYGHIFHASIGASAVRELLERIDLSATTKLLKAELAEATGQKQRRLIRRLRLLRALQMNSIKPEWMILTRIPIIPPQLRPMVALDGGRFATSDLNDLYRRVINRNNRLKRLVDLNAPEVITRNERRMLQEAVDALIDNSARQAKTVMAATGQKRQLKSLADQLKGKQGRFRQNLLGKRTDYSGRSVIVVGPNLKLGECGIPKRMALELFKPFVMSKLIEMGLAHNIRGANRVIESDRTEVWDILEAITKDSHVLLNRAPTLHRLGIQAFSPKLVEGKALQIHPLVCTAYNADFDGDQMAVHLPITRLAKKEAAELMLASKNLLKPATGSPIVTPRMDMAWGVYLLTMESPREEDAPMKAFGNPGDAKLAHANGVVELRDRVRVRFPKKDARWQPEGFIETTVGRMLFHEVLPVGMRFRNSTTSSSDLGDVVRECMDSFDDATTAKLVDDVKLLGFTYAQNFAHSWGMNDLPVLHDKENILKTAQDRVDEIGQQFDEGLLTEDERHLQVIHVWTDAKEQIVQHSKEMLVPGGTVSTMIESGARGNWTQLTQMVGMKGLVTNPAGDIIELPVKGSFREGLDVIEYFISTHGARKGLTDTALKTANAGYLTRRLVDVAQDVVIHDGDCGDDIGRVITKKESDEIGQVLLRRAVGRITLEDIVHAKTGKTIVATGTYVLPGHVDEVGDGAPETLRIRSAISCRLRRGLCIACYGWDLAYNKVVQLGTAVGIIAAQSIGEPGTQLTMRTFHTGGVASTSDITRGLPRVEELFEARSPKRKAFIAEESGTVAIEAREKVVEDATGKVVVKGLAGQKVVAITYQGHDEEEFCYARDGEQPDLTPRVNDGDTVTIGQVLCKYRSDEVTAPADGIVRVKSDRLIFMKPQEKVMEIVIPPGFMLLVRDGDTVECGQALTDGSIDPHELYAVAGKDAVADYILKEVQLIYTSQGQKLNDKHIEVIVRQLFSRMYVEDSGDTTLLPGETVERAELDEVNELARDSGKQEASGEPLFLGVSRVSLSTRSFLSAASFQETAKVLINAAITGKVDRLDGLKENVIIGSLIPAGTGFRSYDKKAKSATYRVVPIGEMARPDGIDGARKW
jgi:DNA-directed RNA polymerase subunit beta'